ncbi:transcription factor TFIIIC subunit TFC8 KNAG_0D02590 [Huiozyma naganishii CBS 8797]|uniref:Transcription factor IIIC putative zinc-finger domain-containing protein n=1 Tax=Huiozyma naganishii (strain ATCC MYA-139 / BCRC 22969 / CBS 8797 / KCTC 17520 / NBRC 10181 / NCYC 3082 / Yp74L-3) TaxID=1071383 RepID=J7RKJ6_HUIN7|nr:hypothetical protein KNAG_0D02590 [Kazachstania naganishii CBS 8797]CCK70008.1 hypothetical protein KNAG_0D02590 [Kazachstania naganishii CBS 8797]
MKLLRDLVLQRRELQDFYDGLHWCSDGTLFFDTIPEVSVGTPLYNKEMNTHSKDLFHVQSIPFEVDTNNKLEHQVNSINTLLNSQPASFVRSCKPCPVDPTIMAVLTNNGNVLLFKNDKLLSNLDDPNSTIEQRTYHCFEWCPNKLSIAVGNETNELVLFTLGNDGSQSSKNITLGSVSQLPQWVVHIRWSDHGMICAASDNGVHFVDGSTMAADEILPPARFKIVNIDIVHEFAIIATYGAVYKVNLKTKDTKMFRVDPLQEFHIIPLLRTREVVFLSNSSSCKLNLDQAGELLSEDIIFPNLERKLKKWNEVWNPLKKYKSTLFIHGVALSPDGYSVAILYDIDRDTLKYKIQSEFQYKVSFFPLYDNWELSNKASGLAWYQTYHIYNKQLPVTEDSAEVPTLDTSEGLNLYLNDIMNHNSMIYRLFNNLITTEVQTIDLFYRLVFEYGRDNITKIDNLLDQACLASLAKVLGENPTFLPSQHPIPFKGEFIEQVFLFGSENENLTEIESQDGNTWRRCSVTLLPLITTRVKVCPVTKHRIIDINKDLLNEYGWFTRTLLEYFNEKSVYTGSKLL